MTTDLANRAVGEADLDPRVERSRRAIGQAVLEELGAVGYAQRPLDQT